MKGDVDVGLRSARTLRGFHSLHAVVVVQVQAPSRVVLGRRISPRVPSGSAPVRPSGRRRRRGSAPGTHTRGVTPPWCHTDEAPSRVRRHVATTFARFESDGLMLRNNFGCTFWWFYGMMTVNTYESSVTYIKLA